MNPLRKAILAASASPWLRERAPRYRFIRRTVERFLPGEQVEDALSAARRLAQNQIDSLLTHLGENVSDRGEAEAITLHYLDLLERLENTSLPSELSVKLTQLGLDLDCEFCFANLSKLIEHSPARRTLWIDMEHSPYVDVTLELYRRARKTHRNLGVCLQAYLYRTEKDLDSLLPMGASLRLVKGAYNEPPEIAFPKKADVDENYFRLAKRLLGPEARRAGVRAALATHDRRLIARVSAWAREQGLPNRELEFEMLYGIGRAQQLRLVREGYRCGVLISYGPFWFPWFMRRLAERPANLFFLARNFFSH
jgi:proline dehydrogenase